MKAEEDFSLLASYLGSERRRISKPSPLITWGGPSEPHQMHAVVRGRVGLRQDLKRPWALVGIRKSQNFF